MDFFIEILNQLKGEYVDIFLEERLVSQIQIEEDKVQKGSSIFEKGLGIRVIKDGKIFYAFTNDLSKKGIDEIIFSLKNYNSSESVINLKKLSPLKMDRQFFIKNNPNYVDLRDKIKIL
ncbi:MAG: TldD/PmbA family protein, partial [Thermodesulfovibrio sp.]|nr:TldD/PmbA family protein [Thermodesulfovibrio sp.]